jgi:GNAT superfamily N-acetyltransferase
MVDGGFASALGTTMLTGVRAEKGWWACEEDLWPSNVDLSVDMFADWRSIPKEAWEDARRKRIRSNKARLAARGSSTVNIGGQTFRLLSNYFRSRILREDGQLDIMIIDKEFDTVAWVQLRAYVKIGKIVLEDLYVKPEARRMGIGSELIRRIEHFSCLDAGFRDVSDEVIVPIPRVDIWLPDRHHAAKTFFVNNGFVWEDRHYMSEREYSLFTARKKLPCAQLSKKARFANTVVQASRRLILPLNYLRDGMFVRHRREPIEGPCFVQVHLLSYGLIDAWQCVC